MIHPIVKLFLENQEKKEEILLRSRDVFLNKTKLSIKGKITNATILLLGKPESSHFFKPGIGKISWILKDADGREKDYDHFVCPFIISIDLVFDKIRKLKYRYMTGEKLFPEETEMYDPYVLRKMINNAIAHQDYNMGGKINIVEFDDKIVITNLGNFIPGSIENVIESDSPSDFYRNEVLAEAMVSFNMIDTIGSGIKRSYFIYKQKFFPLPDYDLSNNKVQVTLYGKILDINYARQLANMPNIELQDVILLDKI